VVAGPNASTAPGLTAAVAPTVPVKAPAELRPRPVASAAGGRSGAALVHGAALVVALCFLMFSA
jgi:hypothetical protein